jgi:hypothetical protein
MSWHCSTCGETHGDFPLSFAADFPDNYANLGDADRAARTIIGSDQCVIDEEQFYLRGCLEIPIQGSDEIFMWGLWALLKPADYAGISDSWEEEGRDQKHGPYKGRLANSLKSYPVDTFNLRLTIKLRSVGERPLFFIDESDHPLAVAQRQGMTRRQVKDLVSSLLH